MPRLIARDRKDTMVGDVQIADNELSSVESTLAHIPNPYDTVSLYLKAMAEHQVVPMIGNKKPPSYEHCIMHSINLGNYGYSMCGQGAFPGFDDEPAKQRQQRRCV